MRENRGISFGDFHTFDDFGLSWSEISITPPEPITSYVEIPGRPTKLDLTESLYGQLTYKNRTLTATFWKPLKYPVLMGLMSRIQSALSGRRVKIKTDIEPDRYMMGRVINVSPSFENHEIMGIATITIEADVEPYKYIETKTSEKWKWDELSFSDGVIRDYSSITIPASKNVQVIGSPIPTTPKVKVSKGMTVTVGSKSWTLLANAWTELTGLRIGREATEFTFSDTGTVSIDTNERSL